MATTPGQQQSNPIARAFGDSIWPESEPGYFAELGRMIAAYATAEAGVHCLVRYLSGLRDDKARAIFGRMRLPDLTDLVRQMMRMNETPDDIYQEVDACLVQLKAIADQRHKLVHRMVEYAGSHLSVSNLLTAKSFAAIERDVFSQRDLLNMNGDCIAIFHRLLRVIQPDGPDLGPEFPAFIRAPWRYKPTQRGSGKKQRRGSGRDHSSHAGSTT
jgi:hypothetical protein